MVGTPPANVQIAAGSESPSPRAEPATIQLSLDGVDAWLACVRRRADYNSDCEKESAATPGGSIARQAIVTFGDEPPPAPPLARADAVERLVEAMRPWRTAEIASEVQRFLPAPVAADMNAFVVANGHPWGDAYVRTVKSGPAGPALSPDGEPVIVFNALVIAARYRGTAKEQAEIALGIMKGIVPAPVEI